jgi:hypothetical protein
MTIHACFRARLDRPWRSGLCRAPRRQALPVPAVGALPVSSALVPDVTDAFIVEETFKTLVAVAFTSYAFRPRGWSLSACLDVRESTIPGAGRGVFATTGIKRGQVLGAYPGVPRTDQEMTAKALVVPTSRYLRLLGPTRGDPGPDRTRRSPQCPSGPLALLVAI